jgi:hypothetical protein
MISYAKGQPEALGSAKDSAQTPKGAEVYFLRRFWLMDYKKFAEGSIPSASLGQELRAVGQGLESLDVEDFNLQAEGEGYFALGMPRTPANGASPPKAAGLKKSLQNAWDSFTGRIDKTDKGSKTTSKVLRILFTPEGILRLEREGKAKRSEESAGIPNLSKLAQILRMVGEYVEARSGRLLKASKRRDRISFEYETAPNRCSREEWNLLQLHEFWLTASNQRQERYNIVERELGREQETPTAASHR